MSKDMNRWIGIGRIGRDIELRNTENGKAVANFSIAVNGYKEGDTAWINVVAWDKTATFLSTYCGKGTRIAVEGRLQVRKYTGKDGLERTITEVVADSVQSLTPKKDAGAVGEAPQGAEPAVGVEPSAEAGAAEPTDIQF